VTPPPDVPSACCPAGWHWFTFAGKKICAPPSPKLPSCKGKPTCPSTHGWDGSKGPSPPPPTSLSCAPPENPLPSSWRSTPFPRTFFVPGCCTKSRRKRDLFAEGELLALGTADDDLCPAGLTSCPIAGAGPGAFECLDPKSELESCGGCTAMGQGEDCTAIGHAKSVGCEDGVCKGWSFRFAPHDSPLHHFPLDQSHIRAEPSFDPYFACSVYTCAQGLLHNNSCIV
jgi:hypothetical protein